MAKAKGKKKAAKKKSAVGPKMSVKAAKVFAELAFAAGQGLVHVMSRDPAQRLFVLDPDARDYWLNNHAKSIPKALKKRVWSKDRANVTMMANALGQRAAQEALANATSATTVVHITKADVKAASEAIQADPRCVAAASVGAGEYCNFD